MTIKVELDLNINLRDSSISNGGMECEKAEPYLLDLNVDASQLPFFNHDANSSNSHAPSSNYCLLDLYNEPSLTNDDIQQFENSITLSQEKDICDMLLKRSVDGKLDKMAT